MLHLLRADFHIVLGHLRRHRTMHESVGIALARLDRLLSCFFGRERHNWLKTIYVDGLKLLAGDGLMDDASISDLSLLTFFFWLVELLLNFCLVLVQIVVYYLVLVAEVRQVLV